MTKNILCFSRSYLAYLMPEFHQRDSVNNYLFIVQTKKEERIVASKGGNVVLCIETYVQQALQSRADIVWEEPNDFREVTNFYFSPIYSDRYLVVFPEKLRNRIAGCLYSGFQKIFREYKVDYFLSEPVAIFSTHILYYLTKKNGGKPRLWTGTFFPNYFYFSDKIKMSTPINKTDSTEDPQKVLTYIENFAENVVVDKAGPTYHFAFAKKRSVKDTFFETRKGNAPIVVSPSLFSILLQALRYLRAKVISWLFPLVGDFQTAASHKEHLFYLKCLLKSKKGYDIIPNNLDKNAVVYPVQYEPEATLLYFSPDFSDQVVVVENILKSLPDNKVLYVKEHPNQFGALKLKEWRIIKKKYHNVKFIYGRESGRQLIKNTEFVVCISSSAGMDALLLGKRVIVLGDVYYQNFTGVTKAHSFDELNRILNSDWTYLGHSLSKIIADFSFIAQNSHKGYPYSSKDLFSEENLTNIVEALKTEFQ
jgi:Capsule polysaccharide biosynthesis protein